ncbi:MAG: hypothetical protein IKX21_06970 [Deltaproteobacteria bacterium]|nr:hypothetical protein [Deltaproteobacteria bacterium]
MNADLARCGALPPARYRMGVEREALRCDACGHLALTPHPAVWGDRSLQPYFRVDFSESQLELVTPPLPSAWDCHEFLAILTDIARRRIAPELLWPQSLPCLLPPEKQIPIADFSRTADPEETMWRRYLAERYSARRQVICGVHVNFSFEPSWLEALGLECNAAYLKVVRNYLRCRWLAVFLLGASPAPEALVSLRNSSLGYGNRALLPLDYADFPRYLASAKSLMRGRVIADIWEIYAPIRVKTARGKTWDELAKGSIDYVEVRTPDVNPFDACGVALGDLEWLVALLFFCLLEEEDAVAELEADAERVAVEGLPAAYRAQVFELLERLERLNAALRLGLERGLCSARSRLEEERLSYAFRMRKTLAEHGHPGAGLLWARVLREQSSPL